MVVRQEGAKKRVRPRLGITTHMLTVRAVWGNGLISPRARARIHHCRDPAKVITQSITELLWTRQRSDATAHGTFCYSTVYSSIS